jgi:hypothetical protein
LGEFRFPSGRISIATSFCSNSGGSASAETVAGIETAFRAGLLSAKGFEWGRNSNREALNDGSPDGFIVSLAGPEGRDHCLSHRDPLAFCKRWLDPNLEQACVVDFAANARSVARSRAASDADGSPSRHPNVSRTMRISTRAATGTSSSGKS